MVTVDGGTIRVGLALSGGGFRAAAFHLGVFRYLDAIGLLDQLDLISGVSGGSIAGSVLAVHRDKREALEKLQDYLLTRSVAVSSAIVGLLDPFETRLEKLADTYARHLLGETRLDEFTDAPRLYINATSLATGNLFSFVGGGGGKAELGEWELGFHDAPSFRLADAVAASSAFPPVFPPLRLNEADYPIDGASYVTLTDGGVYDNLGVNPLLIDRNKLDYLIVSDAGKPFAIDQTPTKSGTLVLHAAIGILMEQVRGLQFRQLEALPNTKKAAWFSIDSAPHDPDPVVASQHTRNAALASVVPTHLRKLPEAQFELLVEHGRALAEARIKEQMPELTQ